MKRKHILLKLINTLVSEQKTLQRYHFPTILDISDTGEILDTGHTHYYKTITDFRINKSTAIFISIKDKNIYLPNELDELKNDTVYLPKFTGNNSKDFIIYKFSDIMTKLSINLNELKNKLLNTPEKLRKIIRAQNSYFVKVYLDKTYTKPYYINITSVYKPVDDKKKPQKRTKSGIIAENATFLGFQKIIHPEYLYDISFRGIEKLSGDRKTDLIIDYKNFKILSEIKLVYSSRSYFFYKIISKFSDKNEDTYNQESQILNEIAMLISNGKHKTLSEYINSKTRKYEIKINQLINNYLKQINLNQNTKLNNINIKELRRNIQKIISDYKTKNSNFYLVGFPRTQIVVMRDIGNHKNVILYVEKMNDLSNSGKKINKNSDEVLKTGRLPHELNKILKNNNQLARYLINKSLEYLSVYKNNDLYVLVEKDRNDYNIYIFKLKNNPLINKIFNMEYIHSREKLLSCISGVALRTFGVGAGRLGNPVMKIAVEIKFLMNRLKPLKHITITNSDLRKTIPDIMMEID